MPLSKKERAFRLRRLRHRNPHRALVRRVKWNPADPWISECLDYLYCGFHRRHTTWHEAMVAAQAHSDMGRVH